MAVKIEVIGAYNDRDIKRAQQDLQTLSDAAGGTSKTFGDKFADMGTSMVNFGSTMTTHVTLPIVAAAGVMFAAFTGEEDAIARMEGAIRASGGTANASAEHIRNLASRLQETTTFADDATISAAGLLLTFHKVRNEFGEGNNIFDRTIVSAQDLSAALGTDLESATMQLAKAMEDPARGMTALSRSGTTFTAEQREMIKAMVASGDQLGAQKAILEVVESQYGGMAETMAKTTSGKIKQAFNTLDDASEGFGEIISKVVDKVVAGLKSVGDFLKNLSPETKNLIVIGLAILAAIGPALIIVGKLMGAIVAIKAVFAGIAAAVSAPVLVVIAIIAALVAAVVIAWQRSESFRNAVTQAWETIKTAAVDAWHNFIKPAIDDLVASFQNNILPAVDNIGTKFQEIWPQIAEAVTSAWGYIQPVLQFLVNVITNVLIPVLGWLMQMAFMVWTNIALLIANAWTTVFQPIFSGIASLVSNQIIPMFLWLWETAQTVWSGVSGAISTAWGFISGVFESLKQGMSNLSTWFSDRINDITGAFSAIADGISSPFKAAFNFIVRAWNSTIGSLDFTFPSNPLLGPLSGVGITMPKLEEFNKGGIVPGVPGDPRLAIVHAGEMILRPGQIDGYGDRNSKRSGDVYVTVNKTDASPYEIGRELLWQMKVAG